MRNLFFLTEHLNFSKRLKQVSMLKNLLINILCHNYYKIDKDELDFLVHLGSQHDRHFCSTKRNLLCLS